MSDYTKILNFSALDDLSQGSGAPKVISGFQWDNEFDAINTAVATKYDSTDLASQAEAEAGSSNTKLSTPLRVQDWGNNLGTLVTDLKVKTSDTKRSTAGAAVADDELTGWTLVSGGYYILRGVLLWDDDGSIGQTITMQWLHLATVLSGDIAQAYGPLPGGTQAGGFANTPSQTWQATIPSGGGLQASNFTAALVPSVTSAKFGWYSAGASDLTLRIGSWISFERIA